MLTRPPIRVRPLFSYSTVSPVSRPWLATYRVSPSAFTVAIEKSGTVLSGEGAAIADTATEPAWTVGPLARSLSGPPIEAVTVGEMVVSVSEPLTAPRPSATPFV